MVKDCTIVNDKISNKCGKREISQKCIKHNRKVEVNEVGHIVLNTSKQQETFSSEDLTFAINDKNASGMMKVQVDGVSVKVLTDSGASYNILSANIWNAFHTNSTSVKLSKKSISLWI